MIITLSNGKRVANFSSPHPFEFEDGSILPAVSKEEAMRLSVVFMETELNPEGDILLSFELSDYVIGAIKEWEWEWQQGNVDVVFCPLPMITALKEWIPDPTQGYRYDLPYSPFRAIRMVDRINKKVSISKQCL